MLSKSFSKTGSSCRVTFKLPADLMPKNAKKAVVVGEFNEWNPKTHPLKKRKDGSFSATITIDAGREYRFRYIAGKETWLNDDAPDAVAVNEFGGEDCVLKV